MSLGTFFSGILLIPKVIMALVFIAIVIWLVSCFFTEIPEYNYKGILP